MMVELSTNEELEDLLKKCEDFPAFLVLYQNIRHALTTSPDRKVRVFQIDDSAGQLYVFFQKCDDRVAVGLWCLEGSEVSQDTLRAAFKELQDTIEAYDEAKLRVTLYGIGNVVVKYFDWLGELHPNLSICFNPCSIFYMTTEQMDQVKAAMNTLPDGYSLMQLDPDRHAALIGECWGQTNAELVQRIKTMLRDIPIKGVRSEATDELVAFAIVDSQYQYGALCDVFTVPGHRRKGLAAVVELECCKVLVGKGLVPYKFVEHSNPAALEFSRKSSQWVEWALRDGGGVKDVTVMFAWYKL